MCNNNQILVNNSIIDGVLGHHCLRCKFNQSLEESNGNRDGKHTLTAKCTADVQLSVLQSLVF